ncbi:MAG: 1,2-phenylacetyl-CoA epoxidase subunit PaaC [Myxococcota bacterium]
MTAEADYLLRIADDHLILGQRVAEWCGRSPTLEEELSFANVALDLLGQSRVLFARVAEMRGDTNEDELAFKRYEHEYLNVKLVEQPNEDFAHAVVRQLLFSGFMLPFWREAQESMDQTLAAAAGQAVKESTYHVRHAREWVLRLGDGTEASHERTQEAVDTLWPYRGELFEVDELVQRMMAAGVAPDPAGLRPEYDALMTQTFEEATLTLPEKDWSQTGGRRGIHSENLGHLLTDLQYMQRTYPNMTW